MTVVFYSCYCIQTGIKTSKSSALSISTLFIFDMQLVNGALLLNAEDLFLI